MEQMTVQTIGPDKASEIIGKHENYRGVNKKRVRAYAELMTRGDWGRSILIFNKDGKLLDGQHRLHAVAQSGIAQSFNCIYGWDDADSVTIDNNQTRTAGQVLKNQGALGSVNVISAMTKGLIGVGATPYVPTAKLVKIYNRYADVIQSVYSELRPPMKSGLYGAGFARGAIFYGETQDSLESMLEIMRRVNDLDFSRPEYTAMKLYYQLSASSNITSGGGTHRRTMYLKLATAIKACVEGVELKKLYKPQNDPFPIVLDI